MNRALRVVDPADAASIAHLQDELTNARTELRRLDLVAPSAAKVRLPRERDRSMFATPRGTVGLQFVIGERSTLLFTFRGAAPSIRCHEIAVGEKELTRRVTAFVRSMEERDAGWRAQAKDLYRLLVAPAEAELTDAQNLLVVPHGILWGMPFHALVGPSGAPLIERMVVEYRPVMGSASSHAAGRGGGGAHGGVVLRGR